MKAQILKLAGVKDEKAFYKKFPSEEAFMKVHGKAFKKAELGEKMAPMLRRDQLAGGNAQLQSYAPQELETDKLMANIPKVPGMEAMPYIQAGADVIQGLSMIKGQKKKLKAAKTAADVSGLQLQAARTKDVDANSMNQQLQVTPWDRQDTGEEFFPINGVGTNVLQAKNGKSIKRPSRVGVSPMFKYPDASFEENKASMLFPYPTPNDIQMGNNKLASDSAQFVGGYRSTKPTNEVWPDNLTINNSFEGGYYNQMSDKHLLDKLPGKYNYLKGKVTRRNGGEIQNTYAPNDLYQDLGFEPLNDSDKVKNFWGGGKMEVAQTGMDVLGSNAGMDILGKANSMLTNSGEGLDAGSMIGGGLGSAVGTYFGGPVGGAVGKFAGSVIGGAIDRSDVKIGKYNRQTDTNQNATTVAGMNMSNQFMEDGGNLTNPQVITKFGNIDVSDIHTIAHQGMDSLRTGGNIRENYTYPQDEFAMNGLSVYKGEAEPISHNPYLPEGGETVMFNGPSHKNGGMPIKYGDQGVEVEGGEPAVKLAEGGPVGSALTVFGNLKPTKDYLASVGLEEYNGQKFKSIADTLAKRTTKFNTLADKSIEKINDHAMNTSIDKIGFDSWKLNFLGAHKQLETIAEKTEAAGALQQAINDSASEGGYDADALARGVIKKAKAVKAVAKDGIEFKTTGRNPGAIDYNQIAEGYRPDYWNSLENYKKNWIPKVEAAFANPEQAKALVSQLENYGGQDADDVKAALAKGKTPAEKIAIAKRLGTDQKVGPYHKILSDMIDPQNEGLKSYTPPSLIAEDPSLDMANQPINVTDEPIPPVKAKSKIPWMDAINAAVPYIRPNYQLERPDLSAEMMAMGFNQQEPVQARGMHSQLDVPYDISYQDLLNKNQGDYQAMSRMAQNNPAMLAQLNAQKYGANQQVLGEQFRANQAMKDKVYSQNRATVNQDQLMNLGIMDKQYERQTSAKAKTQEEAVRIASSISDKLNRFKQEQTISDLEQQRYNYRFDNNGRPINMNPLAQFDMSGKAAQPQSARGELATGYEDTYDIHGQRIGTRRSSKDDTSKNGKKIPARNGAIVRALKTI
jgi:hypothetical protein